MERVTFGTRPRGLMCSGTSLCTVTFQSLTPSVGLACGNGFPNTRPSAQEAYTGRRLVADSVQNRRCHEGHLECVFSLVMDPGVGRFNSRDKGRSQRLWAFDIVFLTYFHSLS